MDFKKSLFENNRYQFYLIYKEQLYMNKRNMNNYQTIMISCGSSFDFQLFSEVR